MSDTMLQDAECEIHAKQVDLGAGFVFQGLLQLSSENKALREELNVLRADRDALAENYKEALSTCSSLRLELEQVKLELSQTSSPMMGTINDIEKPTVGNSPSRLRGESVGSLTDDLREVLLEELLERNLELQCTNTVLKEKVALLNEQPTITSSSSELRLLNRPSRTTLEIDDACRQIYGHSSTLLTSPPPNALHHGASLELLAQRIAKPTRSIEVLGG